MYCFIIAYEQLQIAINYNKLLLNTRYYIVSRLKLFIMIDIVRVQNNIRNGNQVRLTATNCC